MEQLTYKPGIIPEKGCKVLSHKSWPDRKYINTYLTVAAVVSPEHRYPGVLVIVPGIEGWTTNSLFQSYINDIKLEPGYSLWHIWPSEISKIKKYCSVPNSRLE